MLTNITWKGYWTTLAILTAGYYLAIYLLYFRKDFEIILPKRQSEAKSPSATPAVVSFLKEVNQPSLFPDEANELSTPADGNESLVYACMDEVAAYFSEAKAGKCVKSEVIYAMQRLLAKYPSLKGSPYKDSINNLIASEAQHHCSLQLNSEEMRQVWLEG